METKFLRLLCPLSVLVGGFYLSDVASAQGAVNGSAQSGGSRSAARNTGKDRSAKDVLDHPRLLSRVSIERKSATVAQALARLNEYTLLHLTVKGADIGSTPLFFHYTNTPLRDILAAIAETGYWEWAWKDENTLVLKERYNPHAMDLYHPHNEAELEMHQRGADFLGQVGTLPPDMQAALNIQPQPEPGNGLPGLPFDRLPSAMQDNMRAMFAAATQNLEGKGANAPLTSADLTHSRITMHTGTQREGFDTYHLTLFADLPGGKGSGMGMSFRMFQDPRDTYDITPEGQVPAVDFHIAEQDALSRQKALTNNSHLQYKVSLNMENATLFEALQALSAKTNLSFSAYHFTEKGKSAQRSFSLPEMSLGEILDRLAALYGSMEAVGNHYRYTWGQPANPMSQVFVFHLSPETTPPAE